MKSNLETLTAALENSDRVSIRSVNYTGAFVRVDHFKTHNDYIELEISDFRGDNHVKIPLKFIDAMKMNGNKITIPVSEFLYFYLEFFTFAPMNVM